MSQSVCRCHVSLGRRRFHLDDVTSHLRDVTSHLQSHLRPARLRVADGEPDAGEPVRNEHEHE